MARSLFVENEMLKFLDSTTLGTGHASDRPVMLQYAGDATA
jgi:hypothetical protein